MRNNSSGRSLEEAIVASAYPRRYTTVCFRQAPHGPNRLATRNAPMRRGKVSVRRHDDIPAIRTMQPAQSAAIPRVSSMSEASGWSMLRPTQARVLVDELHVVERLQARIRQGRGMVPVDPRTQGAVLVLAVEAQDRPVRLE